MSKSDALENSILDLLFNGTSITGLAEDQVSTPDTTLELALHTTPGPGDSGTALTNEATYTDYVRKSVARTSGGFTVSGSAVTLTANADFVIASGGSETITHFSVVRPSTDIILYHGTVTPNIVVTTGVIPRLTTATSITED